MARSLSDENARLRALLDTQQHTIRQMAEYNRLLSRRVAAYASEINRLKALVAKLQRMQFGKSSEKLREKTQRQCARQRSASMPCRRRWQKCWASSMTRYCHSRCASLPPANRCRPHSRAKPARCLRMRPPVRRAAASSARWVATYRSSWSSSAAPLRSSKRGGLSLPAAAVTTSFRPPCRQNPSSAAMPAPACWRTSSRRSSRSTRHTIVSRRYTAVRAWS